MKPKMTKTERLLRTGWKFHLWRSTGGAPGSYWGHAISPSGKYAIRVDVYTSVRPTIAYGVTVRADFKCAAHNNRGRIGIEEVIKQGHYSPYSREAPTVHVDWRGRALRGKAAITRAQNDGKFANKARTVGCGDIEKDGGLKQMRLTKNVSAPELETIRRLLVEQRGDICTVAQMCGRSTVTVSRIRGGYGSPKYFKTPKAAAPTASVPVFAPYKPISTPKGMTSINRPWGGYYTIVRNGQMAPNSGDGVVVTCRIYLPAIQHSGDAVELREDLRFNGRLSIAGSLLYSLWGDAAPIDNSKPLRRVMTQEFDANTWREGFAGATQWAEEQLGKLDKALAARAQALVDAEK